MSLTQAWSCGGGRQSAAIAALICDGRLPKPDIAFIIDTTREKRTTWAYLESVLQPELAKAGVELRRISKNSYTEIDLFDAQDRLLIPAFTDRDSETGRMRSFCSGAWKRDVGMRFLREMGVERCENWIGYSTDELRRVRGPRRAWCRPRYPLVYDFPMSTAAAISYVVTVKGWPAPPSSACWMCPQHTDKQWARMRAESPLDFEDACRFEREVQARDPNAWLHKSCRPLATVEFRDNENAIDGCQSGFCFV